MSALTLLQGALAIVWLVVFTLVMRRSSWFRFEGSPEKWLPAIFAVKLLAGLAVWFIYTYYYPYRGTSDSFRYFDDAMHLNSYLLSEPSVWFRFLLGIDLRAPELESVHEGLRSWQSSYNYGIVNDNPTIVRINMLIGLFSGGGYASHVIWMCFISLSGTILLVRGLTALFSLRAAPIALLIGANAFPTVLFWSSSVLKEVPLVLGIGLLFYSVSLLKTRSVRASGLLLIAVALLFHTKPYVLVTLAPAVFGLLVWMRLKQQPALIFSLALVVSYFFAVNASVVYPAGDLLYILQKKQTDFYNVAEAHEAGSVVEIKPVSQNAFGFLFDLPDRMVVTYLRPFPTEAKGFLQWISVLEIALFVACFGFVILRMFFSKPASDEGKQRRVIFYVFLSFLIAFGAIAGSTVPVLGAMVRYKLPVLMLLGVLCASVLPSIAKKN